MQTNPVMDKQRRRLMRYYDRLMPLGQTILMAQAQGMDEQRRLYERMLEEALMRAGIDPAKKTAQGGCNP